MRIKIDKIVFKQRARHELGDISSLAESIKKYGQIQPIVVEKLHTQHPPTEPSPDTYRLICGERRLRACMLLKMDQVEAVLSGFLTPLQEKELELEENENRKAFTWLERINLLTEIDTFRRLEDPHWSYVKMQEVAKMSPNYISKQIRFSRDLSAHPEFSHGLTELPLGKAMEKFYHLLNKSQAQTTPQGICDKDINGLHQSTKDKALRLLLEFRNSPKKTHSQELYDTEALILKLIKILEGIKV